MLGFTHLHPQTVVTLGIWNDLLCSVDKLKAQPLSRELHSLILWFIQSRCNWCAERNLWLPKL